MVVIWSRRIIPFMRHLLPLLVVIFCFSIVFAQDQPPKEFQGALVASAESISRNPMTQFRMKIENYTSDEDIKCYADLLAEKGAKALTESIRNVEVGEIVIGNRNTYPLSIARTFVKDGKRIVRAATDRPITMMEASKSPRGKDYPFGFIEIEFEQGGKGNGVIVPAAKIQITEGALKVEGYAFDPFRLTNISAK